MFLRKITKSTGRTYYYILKSVHDKKKGYCVHKIIADVSKLPGNVITVVKAMLEGHKVILSPKLTGFFKIRKSGLFGPLWIVLHFWFELKFHKLGFSKSEFKHLTSLVLARTISPKECRSELKTAEWLQRSALHLLFKGNDTQWKRKYFYPLLTRLTTNWELIEDHLWKQREGTPRLYLYDITSTYFEGKGGSFASLGYSRDEKRSNPQLVIALVSDGNGMPVAIRILPGNTKDNTTVKNIINDLKQKFAAEKAVLIMDRGMQSGTTNTDAITEHGFDFVMAVSHKEGREFLKNHNNDLEWTLFDKRNIAEWTEDGKRYIVCHNPDAAARDRKVRTKILSGAETRLNSLVNMARSGRIKSKDKIIARAVKILTKTKSEKYFEYSAEEGKFSYKKKDLVSYDELYEGCYVLETSLDNTIPKEEINSNYQNQRDVEEVFKSCKSELNIRPNFHMKDENIFGHIYLTFLAHYVKRTIELKLRESGYNEKGSFFLQKFLDIIANEMEVNGEETIVVTETNEEQKKLLKLLGIKMPAGSLKRSLSLYLQKDYNCL